MGLDVPPAVAGRLASAEGLRYGMGIAAADADNDGWTDLAITSVGGVRLFRNVQGTRFDDITAASGLAERRGFSTCAMWVDHDRDGLVDLFVCNYVQWSPTTDLFCSADGGEKAYCTPQAYRGSTSWLFRNLGTGRFEDVTAKAGLFDVTGKALGVTLLDHDQDGWPDLFVANDTVPNRLYRNNRNGTFTELGLQSGLAFSTDGRARAGMGVDAAEIDSSGRPSVAVTNFSNEMVGLYVPRDEGFYVDAAPQGDIGRVTRQTLGWGCFFFDVNLDGPLDLLVVNGHLDAALARRTGQSTQALPPHLFVNRAGRFEDVAAQVGGDGDRLGRRRGPSRHDQGDHDADHGGGEHGGDDGDHGSIIPGGCDSERDRQPSSQGRTTAQERAGCPLTRYNVTAESSPSAASTSSTTGSTRRGSSTSWSPRATAVSSAPPPTARRPGPATRLGTRASGRVPRPSIRRRVNSS